MAIKRKTKKTTRRKVAKKKTTKRKNPNVYLNWDENLAVSDLFDEAVDALKDFNKDRKDNYDTLLEAFETLVNTIMVASILQKSDEEIHKYTKLKDAVGKKIENALKYYYSRQE